MTSYVLRYGLWLVENSEHADWHVRTTYILHIHRHQAAKVQQQQQQKTVANHQIILDSMFFFCSVYCSMFMFTDCNAQ